LETSSLSWGGGGRENLCKINTKNILKQTVHNYRFVMDSSIVTSEYGRSMVPQILEYGGTLIYSNIYDGTR
jgi:hypothetical protein